MAKAQRRPEAAAPPPSIDQQRRQRRRQAQADGQRRAKELIDSVADVSPEEELREAVDTVYTPRGRQGGRRDVHDGNSTVSLSEHFSAADILGLRARRAALDADERAAYGRYLFGDDEPATKAQCRKLLNQFLRRAAGQEPSTDAEKDLLVGAIQHYARKWDLELVCGPAAAATPCRISTTANRDPKYPRMFQVVEPGRHGKKLLSRNALPELSIR